MKTHFKPEETKQLLKPADIGMAYTSVQRFDVSGSAIEISSGSEELCLVVIEGSVAYCCEGVSGKASWRDMMYVPRDSSIVLSEGPGVVIRFGAPCTEKYGFAHMPFDVVDRDPEKHKVYGKVETGSQRDVWNYITNDFPSGRFLTGICFGRKGGWTAWPPHEHGEKREEVYVYMGMGEGFAIQCVYDEMEDASAYVVQDGHLISIPHGYHPNCGCPYGEIRYVFCMVSVKEHDRDFMDLKTQKVFGDKLE